MEVAGNHLSAKFHVPTLVQDVVQVHIGQDIAYPGRDFPVDVEAVHGAFHLSGEGEAFPGGEAGEVQLGGGGPGLHEFSQPLEVEGGLADVHGEGAFLHVGNVPDAPAGLDNHVVVHVFHQDVFQPQVVHRAPYLPLQEAAETDVPESGEVREGSGHVQPGAVLHHALQDNAVYEFRIVVKKAFHGEVLHVHGTEAVVHQDILQANQTFSHPYAAGRYFPSVEAGFLLCEGELDVLCGNEVVRYPEVVDMAFVQDGLQVVPVYDALFHGVVGIFFQLRDIHHLEAHVLYLYLFGAEDVSPLVGRFSLFRGFQAEDAFQVGGNAVRPPGDRLHDQVEPASMQPHAAHIGSFSSQKAP